MPMAMYNMAGLLTISARGTSPWKISVIAGRAITSSTAKQRPMVATSTMTKASR